jgi:hypothetical protein
MIKSPPWTGDICCTLSADNRAFCQVSPVDDGVTLLALFYLAGLQRAEF